ncbi:MAG: RidA family protein [Nitriliruptoraceae bacterium]
MSAHDRLAALGLELPAVPTPAAAYRPWSRTGDWIHTAGQLPMVDGSLAQTGRLGGELDTEEGARLAGIAALNVLAVLDAAAGLDEVRVVKLTVFVASTPDFDQQHLVANGASQRIGDVLGERGLHARSAVGVAQLPLSSPVEVEAIAVVEH